MPVTPLSDLVSRGWKIESISPADEVVELVRGVSAPTAITAAGPCNTAPNLDGTATKWSDGPGTLLRLHMSFSPGLKRYQVRRVEAVASGDDEVTSTQLKTIATVRIVRWIVPRTFTTDDDAVQSPYVYRFIAPEMALLENARQPELAPPTLRDVVAIHQLATAVREASVRALTETLGLSARTAERWLAAARADGML